MHISYLISNLLFDFINHSKTSQIRTEITFTPFYESFVGVEAEISQFHEIDLNQLHGKGSFFV